MKWRWSLCVVVLTAAQGWAQEVLPKLPEEVPGNFGRSRLPADVPPPPEPTAAPPLVGDLCQACDDLKGGCLIGTRKFQNFIGWMSNPLQNIDPRSVTQIWPIFGSSWVSAVSAIPEGDLQVYGAGINIALSERLSIGMNQGGYATTQFKQNREGWLNLGGFVQYTLIEDVQNQFLLTAGLRWEAPSGSQSVFQGRGPVYLAPYVTIGKEFGGCNHLLATVGYEFPCGSGTATSNFFYANLHLDRQMFGWLYPLVEFNWTYHTTHVDGSLPTASGYIDLGNFTASGNILTMAVGANVVLVRNRLEFGGVYLTSLATQRNFDMDGLLVKMVYRY